MKWFFLGILLLPLVAAYDCSLFQAEDQEACERVIGVDEQLVASLIVPPSKQARHELVKQHNEEIRVESAPFGTLMFGRGIIKDAWISIFSVEPSVILDDTLFVSGVGLLRAGGSHRIELPPTEEYAKQKEGYVCRVDYSLVSEQADIRVYANNRLIGTENVSSFSVDSDVLFRANYVVSATYRRDVSKWDAYCCRRWYGRCRKWCFDCELSRRYTYTDSITVSDSVQAMLWNDSVVPSFVVSPTSSGYSGVLTHDDVTNVAVLIGDSKISEDSLLFTANFTTQPYDFLQLYATSLNVTSFSNVLRSDEKYFLKNISDCSLQYSSLFENNSVPCVVSDVAIEAASFSQHESQADWTFLLKLGVLVLMLSLLYRVLSSTWKKAVPFMIVLFLAFPGVSAVEECGLTNLASCIPEKFFAFLLDILNAPLVPLLDGVRSLLETSASVGLFGGVWAVIVYALSLFYGLLFVYAGFQFLVSGHDVVRREQAKEWLKNTVMLIVLVQSSYYLYGLFVDVGAALTSATLGMVDPNFFLLTADNLVNVGLEFLFVLLYALVLVLTLVFLTIRYVVVSIGVLFAPIGAFCWFIPPLKSYGKLIINLLGLNIFISFLSAVVILACSQIITLDVFGNFKILVMITCFLIVDFLFVLLAWHVVSKAAFGEGAQNVAQAVKYIGMMF